MTNHTTETSPLVFARAAALLYLAMFPLGAFGILYVPSTLVVPQDAAATVINIKASELLFRLSIVSSLATQLIYIMLALIFYRLLKPVNKNHALLMVILVLAAVPIAMLNELNQIGVLLLLSGADYLAPFTEDQLHSLVMLFLDMREHGVFIAQIFWGLWLFPLGYLIYKSGFLPKFLGVLLMIGCFGNVIDSTMVFLLPGFDVTFSAFTAIGEMLLPLWLLIKGVDVEKWRERALASV